MFVQCGYNISYHLPAPAVLVLKLHLRPELDSRLRSRETFNVRATLSSEDFLDSFGNRCTRFTAPAGILQLSGESVVEERAWPPPDAGDLREHPVADLPADVLPYLLSSRYCEVDLLGRVAWNLFGGLSPGWGRVQAISDWIETRMRFEPHVAVFARSAFQACEARTGVARDFVQLAITFCRSLNIPARMATGYLPEENDPAGHSPLDFAACLQVFLGGEWHNFDVRRNRRPPHFLPVAVGRDSADTAVASGFGVHRLTRFLASTRVVSPESVAA